MSDLTSDIKSVRDHTKSQPEDSFLTAVQSKNIKTVKSQPGVEDTGSGVTPEWTTSDVSNTQLAAFPEDVLQILRSQPDQNQLIGTLQALHSHAFRPGFDIHTPGSLQAQIINTLINTIIPDFWPVLKEHHAKDLTRCLSNIAGFNAIIARLRLTTTRVPSKSTAALNSQDTVDLLDVAEHLFRGDDAICRVWRNLQSSVFDEVKREMSWKDFVNTVGSGKIVTVVAQVEDIIKVGHADGSSERKGSWLAKGQDYATWLGRNIASLAVFEGTEKNETMGTSAAAQILAKAMSLGYSQQLLKGLFKLLTPSITAHAMDHAVRTMLRKLPTYSKRSFIEHLLRWLSNFVVLDSDVASPDVNKQSEDVSALASLVLYITSTEEAIQRNMISFIVDPALASLLSFPVRRACLAVLSSSTAAEDDLQTLLEQLMKTFNDPLFIAHAPMIQQESLAQTLLLTAGYIHRKTPMALLLIARSSNHMQGVSGRLDSSNARARWLGMVVGTAVSSLVDKEGSRMDFGTDDMETDGAEWYKHLVNIADDVGTMKAFQALLMAQDNIIGISKRHQTVKSKSTHKINGKPVFGPPRPPVQTEVIGDRIAELEDSDSGEDDLKPYTKPDSDPEDSDEDATLVNRNKARPPVYIRDLMSMLRDDKSADRFQLGIKNAATLIRRKTNFGAEVKDHAVEIASILCNLADPFSSEEFDELRLQAMIAILLSDVDTMGPWFCRQAFVGDYSIAQRCVLLSAVGLGGRELAGFKNEDDLNPAVSRTDFPSKRLSPRLHSIYSQLDPSSTRRLEAASKEMEHALIQPLALQAADHSTAHLNAVKVRTFSSRLEIERTKRKPAPNSLAKIFGAAFFFPLINHYERETSAYGFVSVYTSVPFMLVTFLRTLALLLHASGPATLGLREISAEFWDLLLSLRVAAIGDITILQAVLFSLLTLLEMNVDKQRIAQEHPRQLMETQQWVDMIFERTGGGNMINESGNEDETKVRTLAAGVLVKTKEVIEAYQRELIGYGFE